MLHNDQCWRIWHRVFKNGQLAGIGFAVQGFARKRNAMRVAKRRFARSTPEIVIEWKVATENPWPTIRSANAAGNDMKIPF